MSLAILLMSQIQKPVASIARGKKVYDATCVACHQADGQGVPDATPTLVKTKWVLGDKAALAKIILKGMQGVEIDGDTYRTLMPAQENILTDQQIADVLTYVRNSFGNKAGAVTVGEVKVVREKNK